MSASHSEPVPPADPRAEQIETLVREALHIANNRLTVLMGLCDLGGQGADDPKATRETFDLVRETTLSLGRMIQRLQRVVSPPPPPNTPTDLTALLRGLAEGESPLPIDAASLPVTPPIGMGAEALEFALRELCANAVRFGSPAESVRIEVTSEVVADEPTVWVAVYDTGPGLDPVLGGRAGEAFVTTGDHTQGAGLGLAAIHAALARCGGALSLAPGPSGGVVATLRLPVVSTAL